MSVRVRVENYENFRKMNVVAILFQSVRNKSIDTFRHNKVEENYVALYSRMLSEEDAGLDEENEKIERIYKVLDSLTRRQGISWKNVILIGKNTQRLRRC